MLSPVFLPVHAQTASCSQGGVHTGPKGPPGRIGACACVGRQVTGTSCLQEGGQRMGMTESTAPTSFWPSWPWLPPFHPSRTPGHCHSPAKIHLIVCDTWACQHWLFFSSGTWESSRTLVLLDGSHQPLIFSFICCLGFVEHESVL